MCICCCSKFSFVSQLFFPLCFCYLLLGNAIQKHFHVQAATATAMEAAPVGRSKSPDDASSLFFPLSLLLLLLFGASRDGRAKATRQSKNNNNNKNATWESMRAVHCLRQLLLSPSLSLSPLTLFTRHSPILPLNLSPTAWLRSIIAHQQRVAASVAVAVGFALC